MRRLIVFSSLLASATATGFAQQSGTLDPTFHNDGVAYHIKHSYSNGHYPNVVHSMVVMPDSTIVLGCQSEFNPAHPNGYQGFMLCRLDKNGYVMDTSAMPYYGATIIQPGGYTAATPGVGADGNGLRGILRLPSGKILATGSVLTGTGYQSATTFRVNYPSLTLDTTYGIGGMGQLWQAGYYYQLPAKSVIAPDGASYTVSYGPKNYPNDTSYGYIIRRKANGMLDSAWQNNGAHYYSRHRGVQYYDIALAPNGSLYTAGFYTDSSHIYHAIVRKLLSNGNPDLSFGNNGIYEAPYMGTSLLLAPDGSLFLNGWSQVTNNSSVTNSYLIKLQPNGQPDPSFGQAGKALIPFVGTLPNWNYYAYQTIRQPDGKLLQIGSGQKLNDSVWIAAWRVKPNGTIDSTFGVNGFTNLHLMPDQPSPPPTPKMRFGYCGALQPDGKLLIGGLSNMSAMVGDMVVIRLKNTILPTSMVSTPPANMLDVQVSPNPARGELRFRYGLTSGSLVEASLVDMAGKVVAHTAAQKQDAGQHEELLSLDGLAAGAYLLRVNAGTNVARVPVIVLE